MRRLEPGREWAFGLYRSEVSRFSIDAATDGVDAVMFREIGPRAIEADLDIAMYGAAAGWRALPRLWLGAAVTLQEFDYSAVQLNPLDGDDEWAHRATGDDTAAAATFGVRAAGSEAETTDRGCPHRPLAPPRLPAASHSHRAIG